MTVCPVCEHQQLQGDSCDVCGKQLAAARPLNVTRDVVPELETTGYAGAHANVAAEPMPGLDSHLAAPVPVEAGGMPELEQTRLADGPGRTPEPPAPTCRYCGNLQLSGALCDRCGMKLPARAPRTAAGAARKDDAEVGCPACGTKGLIDSTCQDCGAFIRRPEL